MANDVAIDPVQQPPMQQTQQAMRQADGSPGLKRQSSGDVSLLFSPSLDDQRLDALTSDEATSYDPVLEVQRIKLACTLTSDCERKLSVAIQEAKACSILQTGTSDLNSVGRYLRSKYGYLVYIRHANLQRRQKTYLRLLRHDFLVVRGLEGAEGADVLVDLNFRDHFVLPHSTTWYSKLVAALPQDWIGPTARLSPLVGLMSAAMRLCFKQVGVPLPPWREGRAVLSKWLCEVYVDDPLPLVPLPDSTLRRILAPYHKPFRAAVNSAATWPEQWPMSPGTPGRHQQQQQHQQQQYAVAVRASPLPPLPRPPSSVALATSAVRAAAADAAAGALLVRAQEAHHPAVVHNITLGHHTAAADVPRKIIVGFPDQQVKSGAAAAQRQQVQKKQMCDGFSEEAADADVYLQRHQQQSDKQQQQQLLYGNVLRMAAAAAAAAEEPVAVPSTTTACLSPPNNTQQELKEQVQLTTSAAAAVVCQQQLACCPTASPAGPVEETVRNGKQTGGLKALPQVEPSSTGAAVAERVVASGGAAAAAAAAVASAGCEAIIRVLGSSTAGKYDSSSSSSAASKQQQQAEPPAFTTRGVVAATCHHGSPVLVVNKQMFQQHAAAALSDHVPAAAGVRQFKPLDQLLPRIKVIKLGC